MNKKFRLLSLVLILTLLVGGSFYSKLEAQEPEYGGKLVMTDGSFSDAKTLDPHKASAAGSMRYIENMYNTILRYKKGSYGELEGDLAKDYKISDDGKVYTFHLHEGVKFHNGDELTAEDVKYSVNRIIEQNVRASHFEAVKEMEISDKYTIKFIMDKPVAPFTTFLAYPMNAIVNKNVVEANDGSIDNADAGSGPFKLVEWKKDQHLLLEKFEDYFVKGKPYLDQVEMRPIPDATARTTALRNEELDMILQLEAKNVDKLKSEEGIVVESKPGTYWEYLGLNTKEGPLSNKKVRQAVAWGIDRSMLAEMVKFGHATPLDGGPIPPGHWAHPGLEIYPEQNLDKAQALLDEAGYSDGFSTELIVLSANDAQKNAAMIIKQQLAQLGIDIEIRALESSVYFNKLGNQDFKMTVIGWIGFVDPDEFLYNIFHSGEQWNQQAYSNKEVDRLLEKGRTTPDREKRKEIYKDAIKLIVEDAPMAFLYVNDQAAAYLEKVKGFDVNPTKTTNSLQDTWLDD
ncbi:MAG TPA: ABC transporter substrate-binding protein [Halanaerobiales bacterium]|nr:ABC transporter substrate-binding protein [Halanaerobiales bacterium]